MLKRLIVPVLVVAVVGLLGFLFINKNRSSFMNLSSEQMRLKIIEERNLAIAKAEEEGNYRCCIEPPCTMCYMEANEWNNHTAGTCVCDDLIAQGKKPCPQCQREFCGGNEESSVCKIDGE